MLPHHQPPPAAFHLVQSSVGFLPSIPITNSISSYTPRMVWLQWKSGRQTHLGPSASGELDVAEIPTPRPLTIVDRPTSVAAEAYIFRLPDELLLRIWELIESNSYQPEEPEPYGRSWRRNIASSLVLTCHRFQRIVEPMMYRTVSFGRRATIVPPSIPFKSFCRALRNRPHLRQYCQSLSMSIGDLGTRNIDVAFELLNAIFSGGLPHLKHLSVHGGFQSYHEQIWAFLQNVVANTPSLVDLALDRECYGLRLPDVMRTVCCPVLKKLTLHGVSQAAEPLKLHPEAYRAASFTSLILSDYEESASHTEQLIQWPNQLHHFSFGSFYNNPHYMDLPRFGAMLLLHKESLKSVRIGYLSSSGTGRLIDVSDFPNLELLELSRWSFARSLEYTSEQSRCLLAPRLGKFMWDFDIYDQHQASWDALGREEEEWLLQFGREALSKKCALREIHVNFNPDCYGAREEDGYPWDRLDRVHALISPHGVNLTYTRPWLSKNEWLEGFQEQEPELDDELGSLGQDSEADNSGLETPETHVFQGIAGVDGRDIRDYFPVVPRVE